MQFISTHYKSKSSLNSKEKQAKIYLLLLSPSGIKRISILDLNLSDYLSSTNFKDVESEFTTGAISAKIKLAIKCKICGKDDKMFSSKKSDTKISHISNLNISNLTNLNNLSNLNTNKNNTSDEQINEDGSFTPEIKINKSDKLDKIDELIKRNNGTSTPDYEQSKRKNFNYNNNVNTNINNSNNYNRLSKY